MNELLPGTEHYISPAGEAALRKLMLRDMDVLFARGWNVYGVREEREELEELDEKSERNEQHEVADHFGVSVSIVRKVLHRRARPD